MAKSPEQWEKAKVMFEAGKPLTDIEADTGINKGSISRKAKADGWEKGKTQQLIIDAARVEEEKATLTQPELHFHNQEVERLSRDTKIVHSLVRNNMVGVAAKLKDHKNMSMLQHKQASEAILKSAEALGVNKPQTHPMKDIPIEGEGKSIQQIAYEGAVSSVIG